MKASGAAVLSFAALVAAEPIFLNSDYTVVAGEPFTLTFEGCEGGCTITLETGPEDLLEPVQELTSSATGGEFTFTLEDTLPTTNYAFRIVNNESGEYNFSEMFEFEGSDEAVTTTEVTTTTEATSTVESTETTTTSEVESTTTTTEEESTTTTSTEESTTTTTTSTSVSTTPTPESTTTTEEEETSTTTSAEETESTTVPDGGAGSLGRPMALVGAAVGAMLLFN